MALHGCLPWWSGWRTARPRQWGYGEYASCAGFVPAPGAVRPARWRGVRCGAMGSGDGAMAKRAGGAVAVARGQGGLAAGRPMVFNNPLLLFRVLMCGIACYLLAFGLDGRAVYLYAHVGLQFFVSL